MLTCVGYNVSIGIETTKNNKKDNKVVKTQGGNE